MGATTKTVAALFRKGVTAMAANIIPATAITGGMPWNTDRSPPAIRSAPPVCWIASETGIRAAISTSSGPSSAA